jgi:hypothetical protein
VALASAGATSYAVAWVPISGEAHSGVGLGGCLSRLILFSPRQIALVRLDVTRDEKKR